MGYPIFGDLWCLNNFAGSVPSWVQWAVCSLHLERVHALVVSWCRNLEESQTVLKSLLALHLQEDIHCTFILTNVYLSIESGWNSSVYFRYSHAMIKEYLSPFFSAENVSVDDIKRVSSRMLATKPSVAALGNLANLPKFEDIKRAFTNGGHFSGASRFFRFRN